MYHHFTHLVWIGAGTATEPAELFQFSKKATLFESRKIAVQELRKKYPANNISVEEIFLSDTGQDIYFYEYNLAEVSSSNKPTGLFDLYPSIKIVNSKQQKTVAIAEAIDKLDLADNNNLLILNINDINLTLIQALKKTQHLYLFHTIYAQAGIIPLYENSATASEITGFLQSHGYQLSDAINTDPDQPWLIFRLNSMWSTMQDLKRTNIALVKEINSLKRQLFELKSKSMLTYENLENPKETRD